eukprot:scaffold10103_cov59-Phaeocystis_antarctica.AAC.8
MRSPPLPQKVLARRVRRVRLTFGHGGRGGRGARGGRGGRGGRALRRDRSTRSPLPPYLLLVALAYAEPDAAEHEQSDAHCKRQHPRQPRLRAKAVSHAVVHDAGELLDAPDEHQLLVDAPRVAVAVLADVCARPLGDDGDERSGRRIALDVHQGLCRAERLEHLLIGHHALEHRLTALHAELAAQLEHRDPPFCRVAPVGCR